MRFGLSRPRNKRKLLSFLERLKSEVKPARESGYGILAHLNLRISADDIDQARREIWSGFPRDDI